VTNRKKIIDKRTNPVNAHETTTTIPQNTIKDKKGEFKIKTELKCRKYSL